MHMLIMLDTQVQTKLTARSASVYMYCAYRHSSRDKGLAADPIMCLCRCDILQTQLCMFTEAKT